MPRAIVILSSLDPRRLAQAALVLFAVIAAAVAGAVAMGAHSEPTMPRGSSAVRVAQLTRGDFGQVGFERLLLRMDPATRALALRHDPSHAPEPWGRVPGWESLDLSVAPTLGLLQPETVGADEARALNAVIQVSRDPILPAAPFVLRARSTAEFNRAVRCLTAAIYYEAALEPVEGRRAVAQVVLNRLRDSDFPKTVCGVVFQGWERWLGCQFSFTCDGSLTRQPSAVLWREDEQLARQALTGYVQASVGTATFYHADYVFPRWAPTLVKINQIGAHIFYRWPGPNGMPAALNGRYSGSEFAISDAVMTGTAPRAMPAPGTTVLAGGTTLPDGAVVVQVPADSVAPGASTTRVRTVIQLGGRRLPTASEVARINEGLRRYETAPEPAAPAPAAPPASRDAVPVTEINRPVQPATPPSGGEP